MQLRIEYVQSTITLYSVGRIREDSCQNMLGNETCGIPKVVSLS